MLQLHGKHLINFTQQDLEINFATILPSRLNPRLLPVNRTTGGGEPMDRSPSVAPLSLLFLGGWPSTDNPSTTDSSPSLASLHNVAGSNGAHFRCTRFRGWKMNMHSLQPESGKVGSMSSCWSADISQIKIHDSKGKTRYSSARVIINWTSHDKCPLDKNCFSFGSLDNKIT